MAQNATLELLVKAKGDFDQTFSQLLADMKKVDDQAKSQKSSFEDLRKGMDGFFAGNAASFKAMGEGLALAGGAVVAIGGAIVALGSRGADVADVHAQFNILNEAIGNSSNVIAALRNALGNTVSDFDIMKTVNTSLSSGLELTAAQMELVGKGARLLADRVGGDTKKAFDDLMMAMQKGKDGMLGAIGVNVDLVAAQEKYAAAVGKTTAQLNEHEQLEAKRNAVLDDLRSKLALAGEAQVDFADRVKQGQTQVENFTNSLGEAISQSPVVNKAMEVITTAVQQAFGENSAATIETLIGWVNSFAIGVVKAASVAVEVARFIGNAWQGLKVIFNAAIEGLVGALSLFVKAGEMAVKASAFMTFGDTKAFGGLSDKLKEDAKSLDELSKGFKAQKDAAVDSAAGQNAAFDKVSGFLKNLTGEMEKAGASGVKLAETENKLTIATGEHGVAIVKTLKAVEDWRKKVFELDAVLKLAQKNFTPLDVVIKQYGSSIEEAARQGLIFGETLPAAVAAMADAMRNAKLDELMRKVMAGVAKEATDGWKQIAKDEEEVFKNNTKMLEDMAKKEADAQKLAADQATKHREALLGVADAMSNLGNTVGGTFGNILSIGSSVVEVFANMDGAAAQASSTIEKIGVAINGVAAAYASKSVLKGAAQGAAAGTAIMPGWGTAIGAIVGGIAGGMGADAEAKKQAAAGEKMKKDLLALYGSWENLERAARSAGLTMSGAFGTSDPAKLQITIDNLNAALDAHKKRIEAAQSAMSGLELRTKGFADQMARGGEVTERTQAAFDRLGTYAMVTFAAYVRETGDAIGAIQQMGDSLDRLSQLQAAFGFQASATVTNLLGLRDVINANQDVADSISGLNQLMTSLGEAGYQNAALFAAFGQDATDLFQTLIDRGVGANEAMALMAPTLQQLWEHQQRFHDITDEATLALLHQAEQQGVVGENMKDVNERILDVLLAIGEALGATIPAALRRMGEAATNAFGDVVNAADGASNAINNIPGTGPGGHGSGGNAADTQGGGDYSSYALGGTVPWTPGGRVVRVAEAGTEHILSSAQLAEIIGRAGAMSDGGSYRGGGPPINLTVPVYIGGEQLDLVINKRIAAGYIGKPE